MGDVVEGEEPGGIEKKETLFRLDCMRKEALFN